MTVDDAKKRTKVKSDDELAAHFGVTRGAIVQWRKAGNIPRARELELRSGIKMRPRVAS